MNRHLFVMSFRGRERISLFRNEKQGCKAKSRASGVTWHSINAPIDPKHRQAWEVDQCPCIGCTISREQIK